MVRLTRLQSLQPLLSRIPYRPEDLEPKPRTGTLATSPDNAYSPECVEEEFSEVERLRRVGTLSW
jgi:hypothetical protein